MQIQNSAVTYQRLMAPAGTPGKPDPNLQATEAAKEAQPAAPKPAAAIFSVSRFASLMNMARPEKVAFGDLLLAPHMALALRGGPASRNTVTDVTDQTLGKPGYVDLSPEGMARDMVEHLGDGQAITLADAERALYVPRTGMYTNSRERISEYFGRVDSDRSGALDQQELTRLMKYYQDHQDDDPFEQPRLPDTWI
jgi:hypothetical protein